jgi:hypothetical protein
MASWVLLAGAFGVNWHLLPLALVVSLVYAATRHEETPAILAHATRFFVLILAFMLVVFGVLFFISLRL